MVRVVCAQCANGVDLQLAEVLDANPVPVYRARVLPSKGPKLLDIVRQANGGRQVEMEPRYIECDLEEDTAHGYGASDEPHGGLFPDRLFIECPRHGFILVSRAVVEEKVNRYRESGKAQTITAQ